LTVAVGEAVKQGRLWLTSGQASILAEEIPAGILTDDARFQAPPSPIPATDLSATNLPEVWTGDAATALVIALALSKKAGTNLPWATVRDTIDGAIRARIVDELSIQGTGRAALLRLRLLSSELPLPLRRSRHRWC
jgi:hypothetical protein